MYVTICEPRYLMLRKYKHGSLSLVDAGRRRPRQYRKTVHNQKCEADDGCQGVGQVFAGAFVEDN